MSAADEPTYDLYLAVKAAIRTGNPISVYDIRPLTDAVMPVIIAALEERRAEALAEAADLLTELGTPIYGARSEHERGLMYGAERLRTLARMAADPVKADRMQDANNTLKSWKAGL
ncbi:hypothetical protein [Streptomyces microflavus]|uniref:hypothetical protein n=1 Tax=Streptomyces microflavus TaxID=1919 RepID=UPI00324D430F